MEPLATFHAHIPRILIHTLADLDMKQYQTKDAARKTILIITNLIALGLC